MWHVIPYYYVNLASCHIAHKNFCRDNSQSRQSLTHARSLSPESGMPWPAALALWQWGSTTAWHASGLRLTSDDGCLGFTWAGGPCVAESERDPSRRPSHCPTQVTVTPVRLPRYHVRDLGAAVTESGFICKSGHCNIGGKIGHYNYILKLLTIYNNNKITNNTDTCIVIDIDSNTYSNKHSNI